MTVPASELTRKFIQELDVVYVASTDSFILRDHERGSLRLKYGYVEVPSVGFFRYFNGIVGSFRRGVSSEDDFFRLMAEMNRMEITGKPNME